MKRKFITIIFLGLFLVIVFTVNQALFKDPLSNLNETESTDQIQSLEKANSSKKTEDKTPKKEESTEETNKEEWESLDDLDESKLDDYYYVIYYDGSYYTPEYGSSSTLTQPEMYGGKIKSCVPEGKKPQEDFQTNDENLVGKKIYQSKTDNDAIYIEEKQTVCGTQVNVYYRYEKGIFTYEEYLFDPPADEYLPVICYQSVLYAFDYSYDLSRVEEERLPNGFEAVGTIQNAGKHFLTKDFSSNETDYLGCELYYNNEQPDTLYVLNPKGIYNRCSKDMEIDE